jgi:hypothetical protein
MAVRAQANAITEILSRMDARAKDIQSPHVPTFAAITRELLPMVSAIATMIERPDPTTTSQGAFLKLADRVAKTFKQSTDTINRASALYNNAIADVERRENERLGFTRGNADRGAIVAKFSTMNPADQMKQVSAWMKDTKNGGAMLGIIFGADPFLTGLTPELSAKLRADTVKANAPDLANERDALAEQLEAVIAIGNAVSKVKDATSNPQRVAEIQQQKAAHDAADATFVKV